MGSVALNFDRVPDRGGYDSGAAIVRYVLQERCVETLFMEKEVLAPWEQWRLAGQKQLVDLAAQT